jgi:hypothetical protein
MFFSFQVLGTVLNILNVFAHLILITNQ